LPICDFPISVNLQNYIVAIAACFGAKKLIWHIVTRPFSNSLSAIILQPVFALVAYFVMDACDCSRRPIFDNSGTKVDNWIPALLDSGCFGDSSTRSYQGKAVLVALGLRQIRASRAITLIECNQRGKQLRSSRHQARISGFFLIADAVRASARNSGPKAVSAVGAERINEVVVLASE
jgi:hypothetical protein